MDCLGGLGEFEGQILEAEPDCLILDKTALGDEPAAALAGLRAAFKGLSRIILLCDLSRDINLGEIQQQLEVDEVRYKPVHEAMLRDLFMTPPHDGAKIGGEDPADTFWGWTDGTVLLAEDNKVNQDIARAYLQKFGLDVILAANGREAVEAVKNEAVDLVLMDVQMPKMDGLEATQEIRKDPKFAELPIIALTAHAMAHEREECLSKGMNGHLAKPLRPADLKAELRQWLPEGQQTALPEAATVEAIEKEGVDRSVNDEEPDNLQDKLDDLKELVGEEGFRSLVGDAIKGARGYLADIRASLNPNDEQVRRRAAHSLKGLSGSMFAMGLSRCASAIEQHSDDHHFVEERLTELDKAVDDACHWWLSECGMVEDDLETLSAGS